MDSGITLDQVRWAMKHLQENGERVSRRNVRSVIGGGMSTVHRLMSLAEEQQAVKDGQFVTGISETFLDAFRTEVAAQLKNSTGHFEKQIQQIKNSEQEITEALSSAEEKVEALELELNQLKTTSERERQESEKSLAVASESIRRLESWINDYKTERKSLTETLELSRAENIRSKTRIENLEQDLHKISQQTKL